MPIPMQHVILQPGVSMLAGTFIINQGLTDAISQIGAEDIAETPDTPLFNLFGRVVDENEMVGGNGDDIAEFAGRQCYRSWAKGRSNADYIENVKREAHGSIFEHASVVFQITGVSRSLTHELIRHRVGTAYSQESQRYVDAKDLRFVVPPLLANHVAGMSSEEITDDVEMTIFRRSCHRSLKEYQELQTRFETRLKEMEASGATEKAKTAAKKRANEAARSLLPNAAETRLIFTTNLRAMRHALTLRGSEYADLEIRRLVVALLGASRTYAPNFFADVQRVIGSDNLDAIVSEFGRV